MGSRSPGVGGSPSGVGGGGLIRVVAGCDGHGEPRSWIGAVTGSGRNCGILGLKRSDPAFARDCVPVDGRVPTDVFGWAGDVVDRISGGKGAVSTAEGSPTGISTAPLGG